VFTFEDVLQYELCRILFRPLSSQPIAHPGLPVHLRKSIEEAISWMASRGEGAQVLEPAELKEKGNSLARGAPENYKTTRCTKYVQPLDPATMQGTPDRQQV
jgi:hypothetical protein